ncbi:fibronectin type III domain-containing protein [Mucilaginibacter sp. KACC 22773]|uniref:fibronectin type III domain-containing protein n=1 Tax=Mucilaginibacter sp. KACC 22773 TaxID=3025671 RepID=UPI0023666694|nr:fibronectin type III domain-containing protein [Mucilaginibacter sp. KACC 22773]WDF81187.1 fibronectin type III domain-containing protein [Mucilaginibacter sp. KACC 22773]
MANTDYISDALIESFIKANDMANANPDKTQGKGLRTLIKLMRDRLENGPVGDGFNTLQPDIAGIVRVNGGIEQVTAGRDLILDVQERTAGKSGILFIIQDSTGLHNVTLAPNNKGLVTPVATPPGTVTRLVWENLLSFTSWTAEIVVAPDEIFPPDAITDLEVNFVDSTIVQIRWTAPTGIHGKNVLADNYTVYISNAPVTDIVNLKYLPVYQNTLVPKRPGSIETLNLTNLSPKANYYVVVVANKTTYGKTYTGAASPVISFITLPLIGANETDVLIPMTKEQVTAYTTAYNTDEQTGTTLDHTLLVDYRNITFTNGIPSGAGGLGMSMKHTDAFKGYYNQLQAVYFDLGGVFTVNKVWAILTEGGNDMIVEVSQDGTNWLAGARLTSAPKNVFVAFTIAHPEHIRFFRLYMDSGGGSSANFGASVVLATGKSETATSPAGAKYKRATADLTLRERIGTNVLSIQDPARTAKLSTLTRIYLNHVFFLPNDAAHGVPSSGITGLTTDNIGYYYSGITHINPDGSAADFDLLLQNFKSAGVEPLVALVSGPIFLAPAGTPVDAAKVRKPLDPGKSNVLLAETTNPLNYKFLAQFYGQIAARWGNGPVKPDSYYKVGPGQVIKKSLGLVRYYEIGINECDSASTSDSKYTNPEELACILSACWDGHKGLLGAGFGIKEADPTAQISMAGLTGNQIGYIKAMFRWWDVNRGPGDYPIKAIQQHVYNTSAGGQGVYGLYDQFSYPPEMGYFMGYVKDYIQWRNSTPNLNGIEFWIGEYGYDEHYGSAFSPKSNDLATRGLLKGLYIIRAFLISDWLQIDRFIQYAYFGYAKLSAFPTNTQEIYSNFATAGYLDGNGGTYNDPPLTAYWYAVAFRSAMAGYKFSHACILQGVAQTTDIVINNNDPDLYCFAYKPVDNTQKSILVAWLGSQYERSMNADVFVEFGDVNVNLLGFQGIHLSHSESGIPSTVASAISGDIRKINVAISTTPVLVYTNRLGTPTLIDPSGIVIQAASSTQLILSWKDANIGLNKTKIFRSQQQDSNFVLVWNDYIDTGKYTDANLQEYTTYYYRIQFELNGITSNLSAAYGEQTLKVIAVPADFAVNAKTPTTVSLGWSYSVADTAYIQGFELWRSLSAAGIYSKIATLGAADTNYQDIGLSANTTYYYKLRAYKGLDLGGFTLVTSATTDPVTAAPPVLTSVETNYAGDRLTLRFNLPMADPAGQETEFTIVEVAGGVNHLINGSKMTLDAQDNTIIRMLLSAAVSNPANVVKMSYDGVNGTIRSVYNVKAAGFTDKPVTNRLQDASLLIRKMQINLSVTTAPSGISAWTDVDMTPRLGNTSNTVVAVRDINNVDTGYNFTFIEHYPESHLQNIVNISGNLTGNLSASDPINSLFPVSVRAVNAELGSNGAKSLIFALLKVDPTRIFNVTTTGWEYQSAAGEILQISSEQGQAATFQPSKNISQYARITNLEPGLYVLPASSGTIADGYDATKIKFTCKLLTSSKASVCGFIIEECVNN